jgi:hypothetical protein
LDEIRAREKQRVETKVKPIFAHVKNGKQLI